MRKKTTLGIAIVAVIAFIITLLTVSSSSADVVEPVAPAVSSSVSAKAVPAGAWQKRSCFPLQDGFPKVCVHQQYKTYGAKGVKNYRFYMDFYDNTSGRYSCFLGEEETWAARHLHIKSFASDGTRVWSIKKNLSHVKCDKWYYIGGKSLMSGGLTTRYKGEITERNTWPNPHGKWAVRGCRHKHSCKPATSTRQ